MKRAPLLRRAWPVLVGSTIFGSAFVAACVGDEAVAPTTTPDGSAPDVDGSTSSPETSTPDTDAANPPQDAGADAEEITDGGDLPPEDDGGLTDLDGGFDAGPACEQLTPGPFVASTCSTRARIHAGGGLTSGTYELTHVTVFGTKDFCGAGGTFAAYDHRGALEVTATSPTSATFELLDQFRKPSLIPVRPTTVRYDVTVAANAAELTFTPQACAVKPAPAVVRYSVGAVVGSKKKTITLRLPYGAKGSADYTFTQL